MSHIGKKVRITQNYCGKGGQIGIIEKERDGGDGDFWFDVRLSDGFLIQPNTPDMEDPQCEWVEEEKTEYSEPFCISGLAHHLTAMATDLSHIGYNVDSFNTRYTGTFQNDMPLQKGGQEWSLKNFKTMTPVVTYAADRKIQFTLPAQYQEALDYAKAALAWWEAQENSFKPGDYIYAINRISFMDPGDVALIVPSPEDAYENWLYVDHAKRAKDGFDKNRFKDDFRKATAAEIADFKKPRSKTLHLGTQNDEILITKSLVTVRGQGMGISVVQAILDKAKEPIFSISLGDVCLVPVDDSAPFIRIGCTSENHKFSINDLRKIISTAKSL